MTAKINFERAGGSVPDLDCKVREMQRHGTDVRVLTFFSEMNDLPTLPYRVEEEKITNRSLPRLQQAAFSFLKKHVRDAEVIHIEGQFAYAAALYRLLGGKPIVAFFNREMLVWKHNNSLRHLIRKIIEKLLFRFLVPHIDHFIFTTPFLADHYRAFGLHVPDSRISVLVDFYDPQTMYDVIGNERKKEKGGNLMVVSSGRMVEEKGFHLLIDAVAQLPAAVRDHIHVSIGGDGPERARLMQLAEEKKISSVVSFPGWLPKEKFWKTLSTADVFVLPRWRIEQPSVIVMEALALGIPSIVPGGGGVEWMAKDSVATFTDSDSASLAKSLERIVTSEKERENLSEKSRARWRALDHRTRSKELLDILSALSR